MGRHRMIKQKKKQMTCAVVGHLLLSMTACVQGLSRDLMAYLNPSSQLLFSTNQFNGMFL